MSEKYYISKGFVGNCLPWWRHDNAGYDCNLINARIFTEEEARGIVIDGQGIFRAWPKEQIDKYINCHVSNETLNHDEINIISYVKEPTT